VIVSISFLSIWINEFWIHPDKRRSQLRSLAKDGVLNSGPHDIPVLIRVDACIGGAFLSNYVARGPFIHSAECPITRHPREGLVPRELQAG
jgi:hypothetical protein